MEIAIAKQTRKHIAGMQVWEKARETGNGRE